MAKPARRPAQRPASRAGAAAAKAPSAPASQMADTNILNGLDVLTVPQLNAVMERAQVLKESKIESAKQEFMDRVKSESKELGLDLGTLFTSGATSPKRGRPAAGRKSTGQVAAKYRNPNGDEWSGRGRMPRWLVAAEAEGKKRDEFLIGAAGGVSGGG